MTGEGRIPEVVLETERLVLRPFRTADLDEYMALHEHPDVTRFVRRLKRPAAVDRLRDNERDWRERGYGLLAVTDRDVGDVLGRVGLKHWPQFDEIELGWAFRRDAWGHGYATEAATACRDWGFASLTTPYLTAMIHPENEASVRVAGRLGMSPLRDDVLLGDEVVVYALRRREWEAASPQPSYRGTPLPPASRSEPRP